MARGVIVGGTDVVFALLARECCVSDLNCWFGGSGWVLLVEVVGGLTRKFGNERGWMDVKKGRY
jgi:hypothetical protein